MEIRRVELLASAVQKQRSTTELYPRLCLAPRSLTPFVNHPHRFAMLGVLSRPERGMEADNKMDRRILRSKSTKGKWAILDLNQRLLSYQDNALTN